MTEKVKVSVIIPVWNPGPGISRCIASFRGQTLKEIELIFIDDCGTDGSMEVVQAAAAEDDRIHILKNAQNLGAGPSRNRGIDSAGGEYLAFADPDDYASPDFLELLYKKASARHTDIVKGTIIYIKEDGTAVTRDRDLNSVIEAGLRNHKPLYRLFTYEHHSAIYRRERILETGARYGRSRRAQDTTFLLQACAGAGSFDLAENAGYVFCERMGSAMHHADARMIGGMADAVKEQIGYVEEMLSDDPFADEYILERVKGFIKEYSRLSVTGREKEEAERVKEELRVYVSGLSCAGSLKERSIWVRCFLDYGMILPDTPFVLPWDSAGPAEWAGLAERWIDAAMEHPDLLPAMHQRLTGIFYHARQVCASQEDPTERKKYRRELAAQWKRLPMAYRLYSLAYRTARRCLAVCRKISEKLT